MSAFLRSEAARALLARLMLKQQAVAKVIQGRATLLEAADCFRAVSGDEHPRGAETMCRAVIGWVDLSLRDRPERAVIVVERLERELQIHLSWSQRLSAPA